MTFCSHTAAHLPSSAVQICFILLFQFVYIQTSCRLRFKRSTNLNEIIKRTKGKKKTKHFIDLFTAFRYQKSFTDSSAFKVSSRFLFFCDQERNGSTRTRCRPSSDWEEKGKILFLFNSFNHF